MDDFGVLVKNYGINPKGKSAPMAASKKSQKKHEFIPQDPNFFTQQSNSGNGSLLDDPNDDLFGFNSGRRSNSIRNDFDAFDVESILKGGNKSNDVKNGDDIWGFSEKSSNDLLSSDVVDEFWGNFGGGVNLGQKEVNKFKENNYDGDLISGFDKSFTFNHRGQTSAKEKTSSVSLSSLEELEDFATSKLTKVANGHEGQASVKEKNPGVSLSSLDEFEDFATGKISKVANGHGGQASVKEKNLGVSLSSLDELEDFATGKISKVANGHGGQASAKEKNSSVSLSSLDELEDFATGKISKFANGHRGSSINKSPPRKTVEQKPLETNFFDFDQSSDGGSVHKGSTEQVDLLFQDDPSDLDSFFKPQIKKSTSASATASTTMPKTYEEPNLFSESGFGMDKKVPSRDSPDDFSFMFEGVSASVGFQEIDGESKERRNLRYASYLRCKARMDGAVAEMNQREFKAQQEQEEKQRIADAMEMEMKRWAAGKEGNLRALLSSLQQVLGPDFGWRPVSLTDLITSAQVKLAYKKAALCVHPDKVQQRGADLHQKYVAEKTFDLLKEAWNKFSTEELR
ncbi:hypothetical protein vseg_009122 [Gypsophila vaccaria]